MKSVKFPSSLRDLPNPTWKVWTSPIEDAPSSLKTTTDQYSLVTTHYKPSKDQVVWKSKIGSTPHLQQMHWHFILVMLILQKKNSKRSKQQNPMHLSSKNKKVRSSSSQLEDHFQIKLWASSPMPNLTQAVQHNKTALPGQTGSATNCPSLSYLTSKVWSFPVH